ncbi:MAG: hypothetical protein CMF50_06160 [Legionellales bacterium]|nr:hypothetical protein [Legionellales bacterium]|tara:strand:- start:6128 stop:7573 length:1446 start_codon:yes stop_codon:yes gene_type:complete
MKLSHKSVSRIAVSSLTASLLLFNQSAFASAFQIYEQNGAGVGNFDAGMAAEAADASTAWYNPAGLVRMDKPQIVVGTAVIHADPEFKGQVTNQVNANLPPIAGGSRLFQVSNQTGSTTGGGYFPIPSLHIAVPFNDRIYGGLSVVAPFGLETDWGKDSVVRYAGTTTQIQDIDITPSIAFKFNEHLSVGAGIDFNHIDSIFNSVSGFGNISRFFTDPITGDNYPNTVTATDTRSKNKLDDRATSWHGGILYQFDENTRVGVTYHSRVHVHASGKSEFIGPLSAIANNSSDGYLRSDVKSNFTLPDTLGAGVYHKVDEHWAVMGNVNYTRWSVFDNVTLQNVAAVFQGLSGGLVPTPFIRPANVDVSVPQNFHNVWRFAVGLNYHLNEKWMFRMGFGIEPTPLNDRDADIRLPDGDRYNVAIGAHYQPTKNLGFDLGWTHIFVKDRDLNYSVTAAQQVTKVDGHVKNSGDILGLQLNYTVA